MYCGDETGAFIGDIGSHSSRFGYGGEDNPKYIVPSYSRGDDAGIPSSSLEFRGDVTPIYRMASPGNKKPQVNPNAYLQQGDLVENWDAYEDVWKSSLQVMHVNDKYKHTTGGSNIKTSAGGSTSETVKPSNEKEGGSCPHPLLAIDSGCTAIMNDSSDKTMHQKQHLKMTELFMESLEASSFFIAPAPMLAAFSHGRQTCMVVDVGAAGCRVTPVIDGLLLKHAQRRNGRGGDWLANVQWQALLEEDVYPKPRYLLRNAKARPKGPFYRWAMQDLMYEFRSSEHVDMPKWRMDTSTPFFYDGDADMQVEESEPSIYELPDGTVVDLTTRVGKDLCRLPELFFTDAVPFCKEDELQDLTSPTVSNSPLHKLVHESLTAVGDADARKELCGNIVLCGGSSLFPNMEQRLSYELSHIVPSTYKCRTLASRTSVERSCASWIGGSIVTSLGSFQQLWLSKKEYDEYGPNLCLQRFPS